MTPDERHHYEALLDLFIQPGWRLLMAQVQNQQDILQGAWMSIKSPEELYRNQGKSSVLRDILNLEVSTLAEYDSAEKHVDTV